MQQFTAFGRIVWGHPGKMEHQKDNKRQPIYNTDGSPKMGIAFGLAIPKLATVQAQGGDPAMSFDYAVWPYLDAEAKTGYQNGVPQGFSWKWKDGDGIDREGKPFSSREGYAGHVVLTINSNFAIGLFRLNAQGTYDQIAPEEIKTGDYGAVSINTRLNIPTDKSHTPGLFINPQGFQFVGYGQAIVNGPDAQTMFGGQQYALPPGATTAPQMQAGAPGMPGQQPPMGQPPMGQPPMGQPPMGQPPMGGNYAPAPATGAPGQGMTTAPQQAGYSAPHAGMPPPATGFVANAGMPGAQPMQGGMPGGMPPR